MMSKDGITDILTRSFGINYRTLIIGISVVISLFIYFYLINHYRTKNDFLLSGWQLFFETRSEYKLYADNNEGGQISIYGRIGRAVEKHSQNSGFIDVESRGESGSAYENAYRVLNSKKSFGIVQSDTYLNVPGLQEKVQFIAPIYMERLHIVYRKTDNNKLHYWNKDSISTFITSAAAAGNLYVGKPGSSANMLFPLLVKEFLNDSIADFRFDKVNRSAGFDEMIDSVKLSEENAMAIFIMGYNKSIENLLNNNSDIHLLPITPDVLIKINKNYNQDLLVTYFPSKYTRYASHTTIGALATLIGSSDLSESEITDFLELFMAATRDNDLLPIFDDPTFSIEDVYSKYDSIVYNSILEFLKSLIFFLLSIGISSFLVFSFLIFISSAYRQIKYYRKMMTTYEDITNINRDNEKNSDSLGLYETQLSNVNRLIKGIKDLNELGKDVRKDFDSGGMTLKHHQYIIDNLTYLVGWFQTKITGRLAYAFNNISPDQIRPSLKKDREEQINYLLGNGFLEHDQHHYLKEILDGL